MHVVFVTSELAPLTPGGAGAVVARLREQLIDRGDRVSVILAADVEGDLPDGVIAAGRAPTFEDRSRVVAEALQHLVLGERPDLVEIQDFDGLGFHTLVHRVDVGVERIPVQVRFHGPADLMFEAIGVEPPEIAVARSMESSSYRMADRVVVPSAGVGQLAADRYELENVRIVVGQPPVPVRTPIDRNPAPEPTLLCVGRLGEVIGTHDLIAAAIPVLRQHPQARLVLVGEDGWSATALKPMSEWLVDDLIPDDVANRIEIVGRLEGDALDRRIAEAWAIVVASRFESFNLVAHEARTARLPVIVPDLPAFSDVLCEDTGALVYDGSTTGLTSAMCSIVEDDGLRERLSAAPLPAYGDPLEPYDTMPAVRHPRSQAGHATAAVKRLELVRSLSVDESSVVIDERSRIRRMGFAALMALPVPTARRAVTAVPARLRAKIGFVADWRDEIHRREIEADEAAAAARSAAVDAALDARVTAGEFPELVEPLVSVVIPCHDDGRFLDDAIRSVFEQTMNSFEVIVVDDGSTDSPTIATIDELPWTRTRVIRQANQGLSAARNAGMSAARGTYVVPLDADDALEPTYMKRMVEAIEANPAAAFAACRARLFDDIDAVWIPRPYNPYQLILSNSIVGCVLMRRDAFESVGGYDETMRHGNEDWDLWLRLLEADWGVVEVPEVLFLYRKHGISMSVETEARFEQGRAEIIERHPNLYRRDRLTAVKKEFYPMVSIIVGDESDLASLGAQDLDDAEVVALNDTEPVLATLASKRGWPLHSVSTMDEAVRELSGKFVVRWKGVVDTAPETLSRLADRLEAEPDLGASRTGDAEPIVLVRRWSLLDPGAPADSVTVDTGGTGVDQLVPGAYPDPDWIFPAFIEDIPVQRQRPEEEGHIPSWIA